MYQTGQNPSTHTRSPREITVGGGLAAAGAPCALGCTGAVAFGLIGAGFAAYLGEAEPLWRAAAIPAGLGAAWGATLALAWLDKLIDYMTRNDAPPEPVRELKSWESSTFMAVNIRASEGSFHSLKFHRAKPNAVQAMMALLVANNGEFRGPAFRAQFGRQNYEDFVSAFLVAKLASRRGGGAHNPNYHATPIGLRAAQRYATMPVEEILKQCQ